MLSALSSSMSGTLPDDGRDDAQGDVHLFLDLPVALPLDPQVYRVPAILRRYRVDHFVLRQASFAIKDSEAVRMF